MRRNVRKLAGNKTVENMLVGSGEHIASFQNNGNMKYHQTIFGSIKKAEDSGNHVLRIVNLDRHDNEFEISVPWKCRKVIETDLLEQPVYNPYRNLSLEDFRMTGNIKANEIVTLNIGI